jgi:hypothetical protein
MMCSDGVMEEKLTVNELCEIGPIPAARDPTEHYRVGGPIKANVVLDATSVKSSRPEWACLHPAELQTF